MFSIISCLSFTDLLLVLSVVFCSLLLVGPKKYQKIARMYDRTGLSTKCTLIKTGFKSLRTGTEAEIRTFVDALRPGDPNITSKLKRHYCFAIISLVMCPE